VGQILTTAARYPKISRPFVEIELEPAQTCACQSWASSCTFVFGIFLQTEYNILNRNQQSWLENEDNLGRQFSHLREDFNPNNKGQAKCKESYQSFNKYKLSHYIILLYFFLRATIRILSKNYTIFVFLRKIGIFKKLFEYMNI